MDMIESLADAFSLNGKEKGCAILAANKRARLIINKGFEKPKPQWNRIADTDGNIITSPEYRALEIERGPSLCAMLWALHEAGLKTMYWCEGCNLLHLVDDEAAKVFQHLAISGAIGVMPEHKTTQ